MREGEEGRDNILLPVEEGLVTQEPLPLAVHSVVHRDVGEDGAGGVVGVEAVGSHGVRPVTVIGTG